VKRPKPRKPPRTWEEHEAEMQRPSSVRKRETDQAYARGIMRQYDALPPELRDKWKRRPI